MALYHDWEERERTIILDAYRGYLHMLSIDEPELWRRVGAVRAFLRNGNWKDTKVQGMSNRSLRQKVPRWINELQNALVPDWVRFNPDWVNHPFNNLDPWYPAKCIGSVDTFPIKVPDSPKWPNCWQPKYQDHVVKPLVVTLHTGFIVFIGSPAAGSCNDGEILEQSGVMDILRENDWMILGDGGFKRSQWVVVPYSGPQIQPKRLQRGETLEEYRRWADRCRRINTVHAHFRSRVEHTFGRGKFRDCFQKPWALASGRSQFLLNASVRVVAALINIRVYARYGDQGRYKYDLRTRWDELKTKFRAARVQRQRYPDKDPLPPRGAEDDGEPGESEEDALASDGTGDATGSEDDTGSGSDSSSSFLFNGRSEDPSVAETSSIQDTEDSESESAPSVSSSSVEIVRRPRTNLRARAELQSKVDRADRLAQRRRAELQSEAGRDRYRGTIEGLARKYARK